MSIIIIFSFVILILVALLLWLMMTVNRLKDSSQSLNSDIAAKQVAINTSVVQTKELKDHIFTLENRINDLNRQLSVEKVENGKLVERIRITDEDKNRLQQESQAQFKILANEIFEDKTRKFKETSETRLAEIINPLKENIELFKKTITENYSNEAKERYSLQEHIKQLMELNHTIGKEAKDLTLALKGNSKTQGDWGEMILENILEKSGLTRNQEFFVQSSKDTDGSVIRNEDGKMLRPDVIVAFPDDKKIIIDSKVSLTAYVNYINADEKEEQELYIKQHIISVRNHINELRNKGYQDYVGQIDFVMMFIPNEAAYIAAMQNDSNLWQDAYDSRVLIISPTHLISVLKLVSQLWSHDKQTKNALDIAKESGKLYDKFVGFIADMEKIEKGISSTTIAYNDAMKKLTNGSGNLISKSEKIRELGAKTTKSLSKYSE